MQFGLYEWVYIFTGFFGIYIVYRFMNVFFDTRKTNAKVELLSYFTYFLLINGIYLLINIPIILMVTNLLAFFLISYNYESTIKNRILSAVFIYLILMGVEMIVALLSGYFNFPIYSTNNYSSIFGLIVCTILSYLVVLIVNNFKNIKKGETVPNSYWFCIVLIPVSSLYIILMLFHSRGLTVGQVLVGIILIFLINFVTFYLYDVITAALSEKMKNLLIIEQNKYYDKQFELIKTSLQTTNAIKHDLKNHMFSIRTLIESGDNKETLDYISNIMAEMGTKLDYATTGNTVIDSIINFKFQEAEQTGIKTALDLKIPEKLDIPSFDMTIILGNLLDNALKAVVEVKEDRYINLKIKFDKGRLLIQVDNPYIGVINEEGGKILTINKDKENHGIGLETVKKVIQKYNGTMDIDHSGNIFSASILMYVD